MLKWVLENKDSAIKETDIQCAKACAKAVQWPVSNRNIESARVALGIIKDKPTHQTPLPKGYSLSSLAARVENLEKQLGIEFKNYEERSLL